MKTRAELKTAAATAVSQTARSGSKSGSLINRVFNEDCHITMQQRGGFTYDYLICSPPDLSEIKLSAGDYQDFLRLRFKLFAPRSGFATVFISDRKQGGEIVCKHEWVSVIMRSLGWKLCSQKIWIKSEASSLFFLPYTFILTFGKDRKRKIPVMPDCFREPQSKIEGYSEGLPFPLSIARAMIEKHSERGEVVYDPFCGSGTSLLAALDLQRSYAGSDTSAEACKVSEQRIADWG